MDFTWVAIASSLLVGIALLSALYAAAYGLIAHFGMGTSLPFPRSFFTALIGLPLGLATFALSGAFAVSRGMQGILPLVAMTLTAMLVMTCVNVIGLRTSESGRLTFIQGFVMQLVPNVLLVIFWLASRPPTLGY